VRGHRDVRAVELQLAVRAGLARTTVFNHYPRKVLFLDDWTLRRRQRARRAFADGVLRGVSLRELLGRYLAELALLNEETRTETVAIMPAAVRSQDLLVDHPLARDLGTIVANASAELRPGADAELIGRLIALGYFSAVCRWIDTEPAPFDLADELAKLLEAVLDSALAKRPPGSRRAARRP
jgi:AcrR family transcriptional regulator